MDDGIILTLLLGQDLGMSVNFAILTLLYIFRIIGL
jgi:hypothetical protein